MKALTIGHVAKIAGVSVHTIRFYERHNLLSPLARNDAGYRQFDESVVEKISFIRNAKELGFTLTEIKELLLLQSNPHASSSVVKERTAAKIAGVDYKIAQLKAIRGQLAALARTCDGLGKAFDCAILAGIATKTP